MKFVEQCGQGDKDNGSQVRVDPTTTIEPEGSIEEHCKDEIFRNVSELADDRVPEIDSGW